MKSLENEKNISASFDLSPTKQLWFSVLIFILFKSFIVLSPYSERVVPVEYDDAYVHVLQGKRLLNCLYDVCPAFISLTSQISSQENNWETLKTKQKIFADKSPLFSVVLVLPSELRLMSLGHSHILLQFLGILLGAMATYLLLSTFLSKDCVAITFLVLACFVNPFTNWMQIFGPSNYAMIFSIVTVFGIPTNCLRSKIIYIFSLFITLLIHPISIVFIGVLYVLLIITNETKFNLSGSIVTLSMVLLATLFYLYTDSLFLVPIEASEISYGEIMMFNLTFLNDLPSRIIVALPFIAIVLFGVGNHVRYLGIEKKVLLTMVLFSLASLLHYMHQAPFELGHRLLDLFIPVFLGFGIAGIKTFFTTKRMITS